MADIFTEEKRRQIMASIFSKETKPEVLVRKFLFSQGFRYRKNVSQLPGKPDIVLSKFKTVVFVHGCFWHGHNSCKRAILPKTNFDFWQSKISKNIERDKRNLAQLKSMHWHVKVIWQCELRNQKVMYTALLKLANLLLKKSP